MKTADNSFSPYDENIVSDDTLLRCANILPASFQNNMFAVYHIKKHLSIHFAQKNKKSHVILNTIDEKDKME